MCLSSAVSEAAVLLQISGFLYVKAMPIPTTAYQKLPSDAYLGGAMGISITMPPERNCQHWTKIGRWDGSRTVFPAVMSPDG